MCPRVVTFPLNFDLSAKSKSRSTTLWFAVTTWQHVSPKQHNWAKLAKGLCPILHRPVFCESASVCRGTSAFTPSVCRPLTSAPGAAQPLTPPLLLAPLCVILRNASASLITRSQAFYFAPFRKQSPRAPPPLRPTRKLMTRLVSISAAATNCPSRNIQTQIAYCYNRGRHFYLVFSEFPQLSRKKMLGRPTD